MENLKKNNWAHSSQATSFKLGEYNLLLSILTLRFINCVKFNFGKSYLPSDSHTNIVISDLFAYPSRWRVIRPICRCWFLWKEENWSGVPGENPLSKSRSINKFNSHMAVVWNWTQALLMGSKHSHHCSIPGLLPSSLVRMLQNNCDWVCT